MSNSFRVHYLGEFGHFNFTVLGRLERFLDEHSTVFEIITYPDYYLLLEKLFPTRFTLVPFDIDTETRDEHRRGNRLYPDDRIMADLGSRNLGEFLGCRGRDTITPLTTPLREDETHVPMGTGAISMCCRNRRHDSNRNLGLREWQGLVAMCRSMTGADARIIFHGLESETHRMSDVPNSYTCRDIRESIYVLNRSKYLVTSMSGFGQFASNCGCDVIQIGDPRFDRPYNPFGRNNVVLDLRHVSSDAPSPAE